MQEHDEVLGRGIPVLDFALVAVPVHRQPRLVEPVHVDNSGIVSRRRASCNRENFITIIIIIVKVMNQSVGYLDKLSHRPTCGRRVRLRGDGRVGLRRGVGNGGGGRDVPGLRAHVAGDVGGATFERTGNESVI